MKALRIGNLLFIEMIDSNHNPLVTPKYMLCDMGSGLLMEVYTLDEIKAMYSTVKEVEVLTKEIE